MSVTIRLQKLPLSANAANIREFFHGLQIPDGGVNIVGGDNGDAFIVFATDEDARKAMLLSGQLINNSPVRLMLSSKTEMQALIADAQNRAQRPVETSFLPPVNDKRSYTFYDPTNNTHEPPAPKVRVIDYSEPVNSFSGNSHLNPHDQQRPDEFYPNPAYHQPLNVDKQFHQPLNVDKQFQPNDFQRRDDPVEYQEQEVMMPVRVIDETFPVRRYEKFYEEQRYDNSPHFQEDYMRQSDPVQRPQRVGPDLDNRFDHVKDGPLLYHEAKPKGSRFMDEFPSEPTFDHEPNFFQNQEIGRHGHVPYQERDNNNLSYNKYKRPEPFPEREINNSRYPSEIRRPYKEEPLYKQRNMFKPKEPLLKKPDYYDKEPFLKKPDYYDNEPLLRKPDYYDEEPLLKKPDYYDKEPFLKKPDYYDKEPFLKKPDYYDKEPFLKKPDYYDKEPLLKKPDYYDKELRSGRFPPKPLWDVRVDRNSHRNYASEKYGNGRSDFDSQREILKPTTGRELSKVSVASFAVKACLPNFLIKHKTIFDIFKGIFIVSKTGIKIEYDDDNRLTGYVFIEFINDSEGFRALKQNNRNYQGVNLTVMKCTMEEFLYVKDETNKVVYDCKTPLYRRSPYYRDHCLEIYNISKQTKREDFENHFDVKLDPKKVILLECDKRFCCLMHGIDEQSMLKMLSYDKDSLNGHKLRILAISQPLYRKLINVGKRMDAPAMTEPIKPHMAAKRYVEDSKNAMKCAKLDKLRPGTTATTLCNLFSPTIIPLSNIIVSGSEAVVDFVSPSTCQKIISDIRNRSNFSFTINPITNIAYNTIKSNFANKLQKIPPSSSQPNTMKADPKPNGHKDDSDQKVYNVKVKLRRLPTYIGHSQLSDFLKSFQPPVISIQMCYTNNRHNGEAVITLKDEDVAKQFKKQFDGAKFKMNILEVSLIDNPGSKSS